MIDLIIPYYNNLKGLLNTLESINYEVFNVIVIDDGSAVPILPPFNAQFKYWRRNTNCGPGATRQYGLENTTNPYIMFLDTGDIFVSKEAQEKILKTIQENPQTDLFFWPYYHYDELTKESDNRMHGKVYKHNFLQQYKITFCKESSYMNEDIGFNRTCRIISEAIKNPIQYLKTPVIKQIKDENSLTQRNNQEVLYKGQTRALSLVMSHAIHICRENHIEPQDEINQIAISLYYWFLRAAAERPEFLSEAWDGAKIFYKEFEKNINPNELFMGGIGIKEFLNNKISLPFPVNILRFADEMIKFENLPDRYLT